MNGAVADPLQRLVGRLAGTDHERDAPTALLAAEDTSYRQCEDFPDPDGALDPGQSSFHPHGRAVLAVRPEQAIPQREDRPVVCIEKFRLATVMPPMECGSNEYMANSSFKLQRKVDVPVLAEVCEREDHLKNDHAGD